MERTESEVARSLDPEALAGQLLVVGYDGPSPSETLLADHRAGRLGGFIVFKRNVTPGRDGLHALAATLGELAREAPEGLPPLLAIDQEGGRVARLGPPVLTLPTMRALGSTGDVDLVRRAGLAIAEELRAIGLTMSFAPILDVDSNPKNPIIGDRAFGTTADVAARLALAFAKGIDEGGLLACGKHFPGHGDTDTDSHVELPIVRRSRGALEATELRPFELAAKTSLPALMSAHVLYPALDPDAPATLSKAISTDLLRTTLGFRGVLVSDDLEMKALSQEVETTAVSAIAAGCDMALVCSSEPMVRRARAALAGKMERDPAFRARCEQALERGLSMRRACRPVSVTREERDAVLAGHADIAAELGALGSRRGS